MRFSERHGYRQVREIVQIDSMDDPLRNTMWSLVNIQVWSDVKPVPPAIFGTISSFIPKVYELSDTQNIRLNSLCQSLWLNHFKEPVDQISDSWSEVVVKLRAHFFECKWFEVYDFVEFVANNYTKEGFRDTFVDSCNEILEREVSAYRFVDGLIAPITEQEQLDAIELALARPADPVRTHLRRALELLSDKVNPDYRNSIKESISAVEALVAKIVGSEQGTLGQLLKRLSDDTVPGSLRKAFSSLYGYTSQEGGIRHPILESKTIRFEDAMFFLVVCSAFVTYVEAKVAKAG